MPAEESAPQDRAAFHRLPEAALDALIRGDGDREVVGELRNAELSRRKLLLRALLDQSGGQASADAWALLEEAQRRAPEVVDDLLLAPGTGIWLSTALRRLRGQPAEDAPAWVTAGHLSAVAAAAAGRAGVGFTATVPVRRGYVPLPTLGCAVLPADADGWGTARVTGREGGGLKLSGHRGEAVVAAGGDRRSAEWLPTRRLTVGPPGRELALTLEECDPYRTYLGTSPPRVLPDAEAAQWEACAGEAWSILLRDEPVAADGMRRGLLSITPTGPRERFRPYSSSTGEAFGGMNASLPDGASHFAATLVHEFQHIKLGALLHLYPLLRPAAPGDGAEPELFHAPWRDDPRPLEGLVQGIYAFFGVARFWRTHRHAVDPADAPVAHFEYVFWRDEVRATLAAVRGHERFTPLGSRLIATLGERCDRWAAADDVPAEVSRLAEEAASDHLARWREHHLRPPARAVDEAARAWIRGARRPPSALAAEPATVPDPAVAFLDVAGVLARHSLGKTGGDRTGPAEDVSGAGAADVLLARGDRTAAEHALRARLRDAHVPVGTWAVLGRALAGDPAHRAASRVLRRFPERARALHEALRAAGEVSADPVALAGWLGAGGTAD
ncbi:HEXXH motif domain-containing protein [Streptomyces sp. MAR4 CNX-425]|uniref:HEXXH motif domain-containing protein n=1 Tax=Streptomyces sp. MAR4 CNX-425 TaxID=3406343 RepID=UPI003B5127EB